MNEALAKPRLLIVDDNPEICEFIGLVASGLDLEVVTSTSASSALGVIEGLKPNIILLDLCMPDIDGIEMISILGEKHCDAAIILISGMDQRTLASVKALGEDHKLRIHATLNKPMSIETIETTLSPLLDEIKKQTQPCLSLENSKTAPKAIYGVTVEYEPEFIPFGKTETPTVSLRARPRLLLDDGHQLNEKKLFSMAQKNALGTCVFKSIFTEVALDHRDWDKEQFFPHLVIGMPAFLLELAELPRILESLANRYELELSILTLEIFDSESTSLSARAQEVLSRMQLKGIKIRGLIRDNGESALTHSDSLPIDQFVVDLNTLALGTEENKPDMETEFLYSSLNSVANRKGIEVCAINADCEQTINFSLQCRFKYIRGTEFQSALGAHDMLQASLAGLFTSQQFDLIRPA